MRPVRLTLWHMLMVVVLVVGTAAAISTGGQTMFAQWNLPWLIPMCTLIACDAVATQRIVARERLSLAEQGPLRVVEVLLLLVVVRLASLSAEAEPALELARGWVLDPLAIFEGSFAIYLLLGVLMWIAATRTTVAVLQFETEQPREGVRSLDNEEAALVEDRVQAVAQFDRLWLMFLLLTVAGAALALYQVPLLNALNQWATLQPLVALAGVLVAGLVLHSQGHFDQLAYGWQIAQVSVAPDVRSRWLRATALVSLGALLGGVLLGSSALLIPPPPLVPLLNLLLLLGTVLLALVVGLFGLLLLPLAWLLSQFTGRPAPVPPSIPQIQPYQIPQTATERPLLPALIFWGCMLLLVVIAALRYVQQRQELRALLGRWRGLRWLLAVLENIWADAQAWSAYAVRTVQQRLQRQRRSRMAQRAVPRGMQSQLRALYLRLTQAAMQRGLPHPPSQTPYEFQAAVGEEVPAAASDVAALTEVYVAAEYGPQLPEATVVRRARRAWRRAVRVLSQQKGASGAIRGKLRHERSQRG